MEITNLDLAKMSTDQLLELASSIRDIVKRRRAIDNMEATELFVVGQEVECDHPKVIGIPLVIKKINKTKIVCEYKENKNRVVSIPANLLKKTL